MAWEPLLAAAAFPAASIIIARVYDDLFGDEYRDEPFPLLKLPPELRFLVYEHILADDPPIVNLEGRLVHTFTHEALQPICRDALSLLYHSAPIVVNLHEMYTTGRIPFICHFLKYHDEYCGYRTRNRVKLQFILPRRILRCTHPCCVLRPFRCRSNYYSPEHTRSAWARVAALNGILPTNLYFPPREEPLVDFERIATLFALAYLTLEAAYIPILRSFARRVLSYVRWWEDRMDDLYGWLGFATAHLRIITSLYAVLLVVALLVLRVCWSAPQKHELESYLGVMAVTVGVVGCLVWTPWG